MANKNSAYSKVECSSNQATALKRCSRKESIIQIVPRHREPNTDPWDRFFYPYLSIMSDFYSLEEGKMFAIKQELKHYLR